MKKIVINDCHGGFGLSPEGEKMYIELRGIPSCDSVYDIPRDDPMLVKVVETLGEKANGDFSELKIVEIPDDVRWEVKEYDGSEWVAEKHRTWY